MEMGLKLNSQNYFDSENDLLCITEDFENFKFKSPQWEKVFGQNIEALNTQIFFDLIHPEDLEKTRNVFQIAKDKTKIFGFENRVISANKEIKWLKWQIFSEENAPNIFVVMAKDITQIKNQEHFLNLSQKHASFGTWSYHSVTRKFVCSEQVYHIYEAEPSEEVFNSWNPSLHEQKCWHQIHQAFLLCIQKGIPWNFEIEIQTQKEINKWLQCWGLPIKIGNQIVGAEGMVFDLTHKKNEEMVLKQTIEELDKIQLSIQQHCLVAKLDSQGNFIDINHIFKKLSGYNPEEIIRKNFSDLCNGHFATHYSDIKKALDHGVKWRGEFRHQTKDNKYFWVDLSLTPIMDLSNGQLKEIIYIGYDVSDKKLSDERYQTILSGINSGIWDWPDISKPEMHWSSKLYEILMYVPGTMKPDSKTFAELRHPDDSAWVDKAINDVLAEKENFLLEYRIKCGNGKYIWVQSMGIILRDDKGNPYRVIGSLTDVNQKKMIESNLEEEKQKTIQSSKLATLGEMAAGLAHEVNNPLTIIFGYIRVLEEELLSPAVSYDRVHKHIGLIKNAAQRAAKIVTNLKDFARDGSMDPFTDVTASQLISMVMDLCSERFKKNGVRIDLTISNDPAIYCRKIELSQVILNLLFNSFDAIEELEDKWVKILVQKNQHNIDISVIDSGNGLLPEVAEKVFTPFFTTKKVGLGTGIGLSISQRIVMNHNGEIFYDPSSPNTKFVIRLPYTHGKK